MPAVSLASPASIDLLDEYVVSARGRDLKGILTARFHGQLAAEDVEDAFQESYEAMRCSPSLRGTTPAEIASYFSIAVERRLMELTRRLSWEVPSDNYAIFEAAVAPEDPIDLEPVVRELSASLSDRQRDVLSLYCHDADRHEIARTLDITERRAKKDLEDILAKGRRLLTSKAGGGCRTGYKGVTAFAFGLARDPRAIAEAQAHLAGCADCGQLYERLTMFRDAAAALLPVPTTDVATHHTLVETASHKITEMAGAVRDHVSNAAAQGKAQAASVYVRAADPTPLTAARPGAVGAVLASCLAVGGSATYCVSNDFAPIKALAGVDSHTAEHKPKKPKATASQALPPAPAATTTAPQPASQPQPAPAATTPQPQPQPQQQTTTPTQTTPQQAAQGGGSTREFDPGQAAAPAQSAAPTPSTSQPSTPAPAERNEFSGP